MSGLTKAELAECQNEGRMAWKDMTDATKALMLRHYHAMQFWNIGESRWTDVCWSEGDNGIGSIAYRLSPDAPTVDAAPPPLPVEPKPTLGVMPRKLWLEARACDLARAVYERSKLGGGLDADVAGWADELAAVVREVREMNAD
jgi:hypothetical protein